MSHFVTRWVTGLSFVLGLVLLSSTPVAAQDAGVRGGLSIDPDQFYFGGHLETSPLVDRLYFRPNVEVGIGDDLTLIAANMEFVYKFTTRRAWNLYAGVAIVPNSELSAISWLWKAVKSAGAPSALSSVIMMKTFCAPGRR